MQLSPVLVIKIYMEDIPAIFEYLVKIQKLIQSGVYLGAIVFTETVKYSSNRIFVPKLCLKKTYQN